jgi:hypothetical protein
MLGSENQNVIASAGMFDRTDLLRMLGARESEDSQALAMPSAQSPFRKDPSPNTNP